MIDIKTIAGRIRAFTDAPGHHSLYPHQVEMLHAIAAHLEAGETNGTLKAATGTGKTYALGSLAVASDEPTVIATSRNLIGDQTARTFFDPEKFQIDVRQKVGIYDGDQLAFAKEEALNKKILVTTYPSLLRLVKAGKISADPKDRNFRRNIILDEAHHSTGKVTSRVIKQFLKNSLITAWTATDQFIDGSLIDDRLFGKSNRIYTLQIDEAVRRGLLSEAIYALAVEVGVHFKDIEALRHRNTDYPDEVLNRFAHMEAVQEQAVETYMNYEHPETHIRFRGLPCIVNTFGISAAEQTAQWFNKALGKNAAVVVSGKTPKGQLRNKEHMGIFDRFDRGEIKVLCAADLLLEGFDSRNVSLVFSLRPTQSPWMIEQMMGRGTRKQDPEYFSRYGHDKQTFAVNFFGQEMEPLLFSDIIHGVTIRNQIITPREPDLDRPVAERYLPIKCATPPRFFATTQQLASLKKEWSIRNPDYPEKTDDWLSKMDTAELLRIHSADPELSDVWNRIENSYNANPFEPVMIADHLVKCEVRKSATRYPICMHRDEIPWLKSFLGIDVLKEISLGDIEKKGTKWKSYTQYCELLRISNHQVFNNLWDQIKSGYIARHTEPIVIDGHTIKCGVKEQEQGSCYFCVHADELGWIRERIGKALKTKTEGWKRKDEFATLITIGKADKSWDGLWDKLQEIYDRTSTCPILCNGHNVQYTKMLSGGGGTGKAPNAERGNKPTYYIHESEKEWVREQLGIPAEKTPKWRAKNDLRADLGVQQRGTRATSANKPKFDTLWNKIESVYNTTPKSPVIVNGHVVRCGAKKSSSVEPFCIHGSELDWFRKEAGIAPDITPEWKSQKDFAALIGRNAIYIMSLWKKIITQYEADPLKPVIIDGYEVPCGERRISSGNTLFCVNQSAVDWFRRKLAEEPTYIVTRRSIKPGSDALKRTGRSPGKGE